MLWWDVTSDSHGKGRTYFIHKRDVSNCVLPEGKEWQADYINNCTYFFLSVCVPSNFVVPPTKDVELISLPFEFGSSVRLVLPNGMWQRPPCHWPKELCSLNQWFTDTSTKWMFIVVMHNNNVWSSVSDYYIALLCQYMSCSTFFFNIYHQITFYTIGHHWISST